MTISGKKNPEKRYRRRNAILSRHRRSQRQQEIPYAREDPGPIAEEFTRQQLQLAQEQVEVAREQIRVTQSSAIRAAVIGAFGLAIPIIVVILSFNYQVNLERQQAELERELVATNTAFDRELALDGVLQAYIDRMSQLLLEENLSTSKPDSDVRTIARARTLTTLRELDKTRKGALVRFIYEAELITKPEQPASSSIVNLFEADLTEADLNGVDLIGADFWRVNLSNAGLTEAKLAHAYMSGANLTEANLRDALLSYTDLSFAGLGRADLRGATLFGTKLERANLSEANMIKAILFQADLSAATMFDTNLSEAALNEANLYGAGLRGANLSAADLTDAWLTEADLRGANLHEANLTGTDLTGAVYDEETTWPKGFNPEVAGAIKEN